MNTILSIIILLVLLLDVHVESQPTYTGNCYAVLIVGAYVNQTCVEE